MTDRRTPLFPLQALRIAAVTGPVLDQESCVLLLLTSIAPWVVRISNMGLFSSIRMAGSGIGG